MTINFQDMNDAFSKGAAARRISRFQPIGGRGGKIFPLTYPDLPGCPYRVYDAIPRDSLLGGVPFIWRPSS